MEAMAKIGGSVPMASRWRRRRMCVLIAAEPAPAALREISATGAFLETSARPPLGSRVELHHPEAGAIAAEVQALADDGVRVSFRCSEASVAYAIAAIAADMSRPG
jgi:hypothetical protein